MIEVNVEEVEEVGVPEYPKLMESENGKVVLFSSPGVGVVLSDTGDAFEVGHYSEQWSMPCFTRFKDSITLQNVKENK